MKNPQYFSTQKKEIDGEGDRSTDQNQIEFEEIIPIVINEKFQEEEDILLNLEEERMLNFIHQKQLMQEQI